MAHRQIQLTLISDLNIVMTGVESAALNVGTKLFDPSKDKDPNGGVTYTWKDLPNWADPFTIPPDTTTQFVDFSLITQPEEAQRRAACV